MRYMRRFFILWASLWLLGGCASKHYTLSEPKIIVLKTPLIRFADTGYIRHGEDGVKLELYSSGVAVKSIEINHLICVDEGCMSKGAFNAHYLSAHYPDDLLLHVSRGKAIFEGEGIQKNSEGFEQNITTSEVAITYRVLPNETYFKDSKNAIVIRLKNVR